MSITDELREWAKTLTHWWCDPVKDEYTYTTGTMPPSIDAIRLDSNIIAIADSIDVEHEEALRKISRAAQLLADAEKDRDENYANWQDCKQRVLQGNITFDELNARIEHLMDELSHCIELPKDADGEPWHIGDRTESGQTIQAMGLNKHGWHFVGTVNDIDPSIHRHYHAPTVEEVLREFANEVYADADNEIRDRDFLCAKYAKRLTLAEGEDA